MRRGGRNSRPRALRSRVALSLPFMGRQQREGPARQQGPVGCTARPAVRPSSRPALPCDRRGQPNCTPASMEMLLKRCVSQHVCGSQECRCRDINNNTGQNTCRPESINLSPSPPPHAPRGGSPACRRAPPRSHLPWPPSRFHARAPARAHSPLVDFSSDNCYFLLSLLRKPVGC